MTRSRLAQHVVHERGVAVGVGRARADVEQLRRADAQQRRGLGGRPVARRVVVAAAAAAADAARSTAVVSGGGIRGGGSASAAAAPRAALAAVRRRGGAAPPRDAPHGRKGAWGDEG